MNKFDPERKGSYDLKRAALSHVFSLTWPIENVVIQILATSKKSWSPGRLNERIYGPTGQFKDKIQEALNELLRRGVVEGSHWNGDVALEFRITREFAEYIRHLPTATGPLFEFSLRVQGVAVSPHKLNEFRDHAAYVLKNFPEVQEFKIGEDIYLNRQEAEELLKELDESNLF